jgi:hypothetical protein
MVVGTTNIDCRRRDHYGFTTVYDTRNIISRHVCAQDAFKNQSLAGFHIELPRAEARKVHCCTRNVRIANVQWYTLKFPQTLLITL